MKICSNCGQTTPDDAKLCPFCGKQTEETDALAETPKITTEANGEAKENAADKAAETKGDNAKRLSGDNAFEKWAGANGFNAFLAKARTLIFVALALLTALFGVLALLNYMGLLGLMRDPFLPLTIVFLVFTMVWQMFCTVYIAITLSSLARKRDDLGLKEYAGEQTSYSKGGLFVSSAYFADVKNSFTQWAIYYGIAEVCRLTCYIIAYACFLPIVGSIFAALIAGVPDAVPYMLKEYLVRIIVCAVLCIGFAVAAAVLHSKNKKTVTDWYSKNFGRTLGK